MTIAVPIELTVAQVHDRACDEVNRWRGHCIECFARIESKAGAALAAMAQAGGGKCPKVPQMFGDRIKALAAAFAPGSAHPHPRIAQSLSDTGQIFEQRNRLVHATGRILLDRHGDWVWQYRFQPTGKPEETGHFDGKGALALEKTLQRTAQSLCGQLDALTAKIAAR